jgi:glycosyltransferase involved in cell wall biosynthesis
MLPSSPAISVLMPVHNGQVTLAEAIQSILAQTFRDFELIAIDDGSTDSSLTILRKFAARDDRMRVVSRPNTGIAGALNDAIGLAQGEFFARMDADDVSMPTRFEKQVAYMRAHPDVVLLGSRVLLVEPYGTPMYETTHDVDHDRIAADLLRGVGWSVVHPVAMMRADAVRATGGYRPDRVPIEDLDLFLRLTEIGKAANLPDILLHYRQHMDSANHKRFHEQEAKKRACVADAYARRGQAIPDGWSPPPRHQLTTETELSHWAWTALKHRQIPAARRHAWSVMRIRPLAVSSWRLMYCALRGR